MTTVSQVRGYQFSQAMASAGFAFPSSLYTGTASFNAAVGPALASSIFIASNVEGWNTAANRPRTCLVYGVSLGAALTTSPSIISIVDSAGTVLKVQVITNNAPNIVFAVPISITRGSGCGVRVTTTDATGSVTLHWGFEAGN